MSWRANRGESARDLAAHDALSEVNTTPGGEACDVVTQRRSICIGIELGERLASGRFEHAE